MDQTPDSIIRIAIIEHNTHNLYIEDISKEILDKCYDGKIKKYIEENYSLEHYSWDYIIESSYFPLSDKDPIEVDFKDLSD